MVLEALESLAVTLVTSAALISSMRILKASWTGRGMNSRGS
jgi:hypothetical protein